MRSDARIAARFTERIAEPAEKRIPLFVRRMAGPLTILLVTLLSVFLARTFRVETPPNKGLANWGELSIGLAIALVLVRLFDYLLFDIGFRRRRGAVAPGLLRQLVSLVLFGVAVSLVVKAVFPGVDLRAVLTGSAIITAVIGLALQDPLGNLFAGLALHFERTIRVGDVIRSGETHGIIEELSWRAIKLRTMEGNLMLIPNSVAGRDRLEIFPRPGPPVARFLRVGLEYDASPVVARETLENALRGMKGLAGSPSRRAYVKSFEPYSILYELRYWIEDYADYVEIDSQVRERVWYALHRAGLPIPMPFIRQYQYAGGAIPPLTRGAGVEPAVDNLDLFSPLSKEQRERISDGAVERRYAPGEIIVRQGDRTSSMFVVASGRAGVSIHGAGGDTRNLALLEEGSAFGEISLLTGEPRTATVRAMTETVVIEIDKATIEPIIRGNPALCGAMQEVIEQRRRATADLFDASREELARTPERTALAERIAHFFGLG